MEVSVAFTVNDSCCIVYTVDVFGCLLTVGIDLENNVVTGIIEIFLYVSVDILSYTDTVAVVTESDGLIAYIRDDYLIL